MYKHGQACYNHGRFFSPFVFLVDGMMGKEALVLLATFSQLMITKMLEPIFTSQVGLTVRSPIVFTRSYSRVP